MTTELTAAARIRQQFDRAEKAEAELATVKAERDRLQAWTNRVRDTTAALESMRVRLSEAEAELTRLRGEQKHGIVCQCGGIDVPDQMGLMKRCTCGEQKGDA